MNERTAIANRVHTDLEWLRPGYQHQLPHLTNMAAPARCTGQLSGDDSVPPDGPAPWPRPAPQQPHPSNGNRISGLAH